MNQHEYIAGFYGVLIGFTLTELISGIARTIKNLERVKYFYLHALASVLTFLLIIFVFFEFFQFFMVVKDWSPLSLLRFSFPAIFVCFFSYLLFPEFAEGVVDFKEHYFKIVPKVWMLGVIDNILVLIRNIYHHGFAILVTPESGIAIVFIVALSILAITKRHWVHGTLLVLLIALMVYWTLTFSLDAFVYRKFFE